jgi:hypothetical protein
MEDKFVLHVYAYEQLMQVDQYWLEYRYKKLVLMTYGIVSARKFSEISIDKRLHAMLRNGGDAWDNISDYMTRGMLYRLFMQNLQYTTREYKNIWYMQRKGDWYNYVKLIKQ